MTQVQLPSGRVGETAQRDLLRALVRSTDSGPARPTKTVAPPGGFAAFSGAGLMSLAATPDTDAPEPEVMPLVGGWSLTTDQAGALVFQHEDGSRQVVASRNVPAREDDNHG